MTTTYEYIQIVKREVERVVEEMRGGRPERVVCTQRKYELHGIKFIDDIVQYPDGRVEVDRTAFLPPARMVIDLKLDVEV